MQDITEHLAAWLAEHKAQLSLSITGPKGGSVPPETWVPAGWQIVITVVAPVTEEKPVDGPYTALAE